MLFKPLPTNFNLPLKPHPSILIATDLDRTLLHPPYLFNPGEVDLLASLHREGVNFLFATGKTEKGAKDLLSPLPFTYYLAPQNGTTLYEMPHEKILVSHEMVPPDEPGWLTVCLGASYYNPDEFTEEEKSYFLERSTLLGEICLAKKPQPPYFSWKRFGDLETLKAKVAHLKDRFNVTLTRDVLHPDRAVAQITPKAANKGKAVDDLIEYLPLKPSLIIGCGDDYNDIPLLERSDIRIVMEDAPPELHGLSHFTAKTSDKGGLFIVLREIFNLL